MKFLQDNRVLISWQDIKERSEIMIRAVYGKSVKVYGVPRGGQSIAALFNPVDHPGNAEIIVDDLIDSGATEQRFYNEFPGTPFVALFNKQTEPEFSGKWLVFPWETDEGVFQDAETNFTRILERVGVNVTTEGLAQTPKRYIKFLSDFLDTRDFNFTTFDSNGYDEMIVETDIPFYSLCEHHTLPFFGTVCVGYIPAGRIAGLSKIPRTVEKFASGLQNQERLTQQIADFLATNLGTENVAVVVKARHLCMEMRGAKSVGTSTTTSTMKGQFRTYDKCRAEFLKIISR